MTWFDCTHWWVLGWHLGIRKDPSLTLEALSRALSGRRVKHGLIFHSDRGVEYAAYAYRTRLAAPGILQSMRRRHNLNDNAFMESFFHSMKAEAIDGRSFDDDQILHPPSASPPSPLSFQPFGDRRSMGAPGSGKHRSELRTSRGGESFQLRAHQGPALSVPGSVEQLSSRNTGHIVAPVRAPQ